MENPQNVERLVVGLIEELICNFHVVCHGSQSILEPWPELVLVGYPRNVAWKVAIFHSVYPLSCLIEDETEMALVAF